MTIDYEDKELFFFHDFPLRCTEREAADYENNIRGWALSLELNELRARLAWALRNGTEDRVAELDRKIQHAMSEIYEKVKRWAVYHNKAEAV